MAGKLCNGGQFPTSFNPRNATAFCEGMNHRATGTIATRPISDNPHEVDSEAHICWDQGWLLVQNKVGQKLLATDFPCCAVPTNTIAS